MSRSVSDSRRSRKREPDVEADRVFEPRELVVDESLLIGDALDLIISSSETLSGALEAIRWIRRSPEATAEASASVRERRIAKLRDEIEFRLSFIAAEVERTLGPCSSEAARWEQDAAGPETARPEPSGDPEGCAGSPVPGPRPMPDARR